MNFGPANSNAAKAIKGTPLLGLAMFLSACTYSGVPEGTKLPDTWPFVGSAGECMFVANTSPVDFDDLVVISETDPCFEGFFDTVFSVRDESRLKQLVALSSKKHAFTPEAEWALVFSEPLQIESGFDGAWKRLAEGKVTISFTGILEGKWLDGLQDLDETGKTDIDSNNWIPASSQNNFYDPASSFLNDNYKTLGEWSELLKGPRYDRVRSLVFYEDRAGRKRMQVGTFGAMRNDVFSEEFTLEKLVKGVLKVYYDPKNKQFASNRPLKGINLGAHGESSGLVLEYDRIARAYPAAQVKDIYYDLLRWKPGRVPRWIKRGMAKRIVATSAYTHPFGKVQLKTLE